MKEDEDEDDSISYIIRFYYHMAHELDLTDDDALGGLNMYDWFHESSCERWRNLAPLAEDLGKYTLGQIKEFDKQRRDRLQIARNKAVAGIYFLLQSGIY